MLQRRYPYTAAGKFAAALFAVAFLAAGIFFNGGLSVGADAVVPAVVWAAIAAAASFMVFSSEAERRPISVEQASIADGLISGALTGGSCAVFLALLRGGAGTGGSGPSAGAVLVAVLAGLALGGAGGALLGWIVLLIAGRERLARAFTRTHRRPRSKSKEKHRRRR